MCVLQMDWYPYISIFIFSIPSHMFQTHLYMFQTHPIYFLNPSNLFIWVSHPSDEIAYSPIKHDFPSICSIPIHLKCNRTTDLFAEIQAEGSVRGTYRGE
eukprot:60901_1